MNLSVDQLLDLSTLNRTLIHFQADFHDLNLEADVEEVLDLTRLGGLIVSRKG